VETKRGRWAAHVDGDFVVFLIGARIHRLHAVRTWWPVFRAMPRMLAELGRHPELGLLHASTAFESPRSVVVTQYWRSFEHLHAWARDRDAAHLPAWAAYNRAVSDNPSVGIWHETYLVCAGAFEAIYGDMPPRGLGRAGTLVPAEGRERSALGRLGRTAGDDLPLTDAGTPRPAGSAPRER
jgi:heme-degrading monooxygenase HmoA